MMWVGNGQGMGWHTLLQVACIGVDGPFMMWDNPVTLAQVVYEGHEAKSGHLGICRTRSEIACVLTRLPLRYNNNIDVCQASSRSRGARHQRKHSTHEKSSIWQSWHKFRMSANTATGLPQQNGLRPCLPVYQYIPTGALSAFTRHCHALRTPPWRTTSLPTRHATLTVE